MKTNFKGKVNDVEYTDINEFIKTLQSGNLGDFRNISLEYSTVSDGKEKDNFNPFNFFSNKQSRKVVDQPKKEFDPKDLIDLDFDSLIERGNCYTIQNTEGNMVDILKKYIDLDESEKKIFRDYLSTELSKYQKKSNELEKEISEYENKSKSLNELYIKAIKEIREIQDQTQLIIYKKSTCNATVEFYNILLDEIAECL